MRAIRKYDTESAYNADVINKNIVANQVTKTEDTGEVHYIVSDYTFTFTYDTQNCSIYSYASQTVHSLTDTQLGTGSLTELHFNILKNGGRNFYLLDAQASTTRHITKVEYSSDATSRFGWGGGDKQDYLDTIAAGGTDGQFFMNFIDTMQDLLELTIDGTDKMFILRNNFGELLLVDVGVDTFTAAVEAAHNA